MHKGFYLIVLLLFAGNEASAADSSDFYLKIDLTHRERSKDSNVQRYTIEVNDTQVSCHYSYGGFPGAKKDTAQYRLTKKERDSILAAIMKEKLNVPVNETRSTKANGPSRSVNLSLHLRYNGKTVTSHISGNMRINRGDGKIKGEIITHQAYVRDVTSLARDLLEQDLPGTIRND